MPLCTRVRSCACLRDAAAEFQDSAICFPNLTAARAYKRAEIYAYLEFGNEIALVGASGILFCIGWLYPRAPCSLSISRAYHLEGTLLFLGLPDPMADHLQSDRHNSTRDQVVDCSGTPEPFAKPDTSGMSPTNKS